MVFISDSGRQIQVDPELLHSAYGLTPAEARVAITTLECATLQDVADRLEISVATICVHVKRIYTKCGVDTRARFATMMAGLSGHVGEW